MQKKQVISIFVVLCLMSTFAAQLSMITMANDGEQENTTLKDKNEAGLTLTNSQISTIWPNLPSVDELLAMETVGIYDSAECGKIDTESGLIMTDPTATLQPLTMRNYTDRFPPHMEILPMIWIQIEDTTRWIQVPIDLLMSTNQTAIPFLSD